MDVKIPTLSHKPREGWGTRIALGPPRSGECVPGFWASRPPRCLAGREGSEMKFQRSSHCSRWGVLEGNLFALFGDLVDAVGDVCDVEFEVEAARFGVPDGQPRREIAGEMLR